MPKQISTETIIEELNRIREIVRKASNIDQLPLIERDLILSRLRWIYEQFSGITGIVSRKPEQTDYNIPEPAIPDEKENDTATFELEQPETEQHRVQPEGRPHAEAEKQEKKIKKESTGIIAEKLKGEKQFIYDSLVERAHHQNLSAKLQSKPITNIAEAIGINDKFQLIRDLFKGDKETYNKTIKTLNEAANFNEAFTFINENFEWDMEDLSVQFLLDLVRRKFIVSKNE